MLCQIRSNQFVKSIYSGMDWSFEVFYFTKSKLAYGLILSMRLTVIQMNISWLWHVKEFWGIFPRHAWNISLRHWARGNKFEYKRPLSTLWEYAVTICYMMVKQYYVGMYSMHREIGVLSIRMNRQKKDHVFIKRFDILE